MTDKSHKLAKLIIVAGGTALGVFLIAKYHKNIIQRFMRAKNRFLYDHAITRASFKVEIINDAAECERIIANIQK